MQDLYSIKKMNELKMTQQRQPQLYTLKDTVRFYLKVNGWHTYALDKDTVDNICSGVNLGIFKINSERNKCRIKSREKALSYLKYGKGE